MTQSVCRIDNGLCMTHGYSVSEKVQCPEAMPTVKVGDIFYESWGYEQTNIDFAQIVGFTKSGKTAICRLMSQKIHSTEGLSPMAEMVLPDSEYGITFRLRVRNGVNVQEPCLLGTYPFVQKDGQAWGKRFGYFYPYYGKPIYQSHYA